MAPLFTLKYIINDYMDHGNQSLRETIHKIPQKKFRNLVKSVNKFINPRRDFLKLTQGGNFSKNTLKKNIGNLSSVVDLETNSLHSSPEMGRDPTTMGRSGTKEGEINCENYLEFLLMVLSKEIRIKDNGVSNILEKILEIKSRSKLEIFIKAVKKYLSYLGFSALSKLNMSQMLSKNELAFDLMRNKAVLTKVEEKLEKIPHSSMIKILEIGVPVGVSFFAAFASCKEMVRSSLEAE